MVVASKWREWTARYGWAELWGTVGSYACFFAAALSGLPRVGASYGAALGENVGYYGCILWREWRARRASGELVGVSGLRAMVTDLIYEFGIPELIDSVLVRPGATYFATKWFGALGGVIAGKLAADAVFYALTITLYEARRDRSSKQV